MTRRRPRVYAKNGLAKAKRAPRKHEEHDMQVSVIRWCALMEGRYPALKLIFAVPNAGVAGGARRGAWLKAEGVKAGVPDLMLPFPALGLMCPGPFYGLAVELKTATGRLSEEQVVWHARLDAADWRVVVCRSAADAIAAISDYLGIPRTA